MCILLMCALPFIVLYFHRPTKASDIKVGLTSDWCGGFLLALFSNQKVVISPLPFTWILPLSLVA